MGWVVNVWRISVLAVLVLMVSGGAVAGQQAAAPPRDPRLPDFLSAKPRMPDALLEDKREGRYLTAIPLVGWDAEEGIYLGAGGEWFDNTGGPLFVGDHFQFVLDGGVGLKGTWRATVSPAFRF